MFRPRLHRLGVLSTAAASTILLLSAGCENAPSRVVSSADPVSVGHASQSVQVSATSISTVDPKEASALRVLTYAVARAFQDVGLRQRLLSDIRKLGVSDELKLPFQSYLQGNGGILMAKMEQHSGIPRDSLQLLLGMVRPQELYLPVRAHRDAWKGEDVIVASQLKEHEPITGYQSDGTPVALDVAHVPSQFTVAIVGAETDFTQPAFSRTVAGQVAFSRASSSRFSAPSGPLRTYQPPPSGEGPGGGSTRSIPQYSPTGVYMTYASIYDMHEPWIRGDPELELHMVGSGYPYDPPSYVRDLACSAEHATGDRYYDQNATPWSGSTLAYKQGEFDGSHAVDTLPSVRTLYMVMYEDDDAACIIRDDPNRIRDQTGILAGWTAAGFGLVEGCLHGASDLSCNLGALGLLYALGASAWSFAQTNDDYVGMAVRKDQVPGLTDPYANYALLTDGTQQSLNGGVKLEWHVYGY